MYYKKAAIALLLLTVSFTAFTQKHGIGVKFGGNITMPTTTTNKYGGSIKYYPGFEVALLYCYQINKSISISFEPGFTQKSFGENYQPVLSDENDPVIGGAPMMTNIYQIRYIAVPLLINYDFISRAKFTLGLQAGFTTNFTLAGKVKYKDGGSDMSDGKLSNLKATMFEIPMGLKVNFKISKSLWLGASPRFSLGLTEIGNKFQGKYEIWPLNSKINTFTLRVSLEKKF